MSEKKKIIFVCEHGSAKSIIAATCFNKLNQEKGLPAQAIARDTNPVFGLSSYAIADLLADGLAPSQPALQKLAQEELEAADLIALFCELPAVGLGKTHIEYWNNVPAMSENYKKARDMILARIQDMIKDPA